MSAECDMRYCFNQGKPVGTSFEENPDLNGEVLPSTTTSSPVDGCYTGNPDENGVDLDLTCCICLDTFSLDTKEQREVKVSLLVQCGHFYHEKCWSDWTNIKGTEHRSCPTCRTAVSYDMEIEVLATEALFSNKKSISGLRQKHAERRKLHSSRRSSQENSESNDEDEDPELMYTEWVHISLHPMENGTSLAIQHSSDNTHDTENDRPDSPFTIITPEEIPRSRSENESMVGRSEAESSGFSYDDVYFGLLFTHLVSLASVSDGMPILF